MKEVQPCPIDWALSLERGNNNQEIAEECLTMFMEELPEFSTAIITAYKNKNYSELYDQIHKLHGGCHYVGVPKLMLLLGEIETLLLTKKESMIDELIKNVGVEITSIQNAYQDKSYLSENNNENQDVT